MPRHERGGLPAIRSGYLPSRFPSWSREWQQSPTRPIARRTSELLKLAHSLSDADFDNQRPDLENQAREITKVDASTALRHWMECEMAQLLSNPQLPLALADRSSWSRELHQLPGSQMRHSQIAGQLILTVLMPAFVGANDDRDRAVGARCQFRTASLRFPVGPKSVPYAPASV